MFSLKTVCLLKNSANNKGGGLYTSENTWARVTACAFLGNAAGFGGAIGSLYGSNSQRTNNVRIEKSNFKDNYGNIGGAIYAAGALAIRICLI